MTRPRSLAPFAVLLALYSAGCKDPDSDKLFDEQGTWTLIKYDIGEGLRDVIYPRTDAFLLHFDTELEVVQTAACVADGQETPGDSPCRNLPDQTRWDCRCFAYAFEDSNMAWAEFTAGDVPPPVEIGEAGADPVEGTVSISVVALPEQNDTYAFQPLPMGTFGSDGTASTHVFQPLAETAFNQALMDPDGRSSCEPCLP